MDTTRIKELARVSLTTLAYTHIVRHDTRPHAVLNQIGPQVATQHNLGELQAVYSNIGYRLTGGGYWFSQAVDLRQCQVFHTEAVWVALGLFMYQGRGIHYPEALESKDMHLAIDFEVISRITKGLTGKEQIWPVWGDMEYECWECGNNLGRLIQRIQALPQPTKKASVELKRVLNIISEI